MFSQPTPFSILKIMYFYTNRCKTAFEKYVMTKIVTVTYLNALKATTLITTFNKVI